jgi:drug/metabolite transporter (DMT)-like permease
LIDEIDNTYLGLSGTIWCLIAGLGYGFMNVFAKLAFEKGLEVSRFVLIRHLVLLVCSYTFGKLKRGLDFDLRKYEVAAIKLVFFRSALGCVSKCCEYAAIAYIPLTLSSTISFTTGPIFSGVLAWVLIGEKLSCLEVIIITFGIIGTIMITMP